ncbi:MAG TPA: DNA-binding domain-containing protein [Polyangiaceae bacterium]|nr:DNA-binding domain-containing protein [Polyangiaceae bacterium]
MAQDQNLSQIQEQLTAFLQQRKALDKSATARAFAEREIGGNERLSPVEQLEIYREQFWLRHTSALLEDFPGLSGIIGQGAWERLVEEYLDELPPTSFTLRDLGDRLPEFVAKASWLEHHELCLDMTRLEWAYVEAFDAADVAPLTPARLASIPDEAWETARFVLGPSLALLRVNYPVFELRKRLVLAGDENVAIPERAPALLAVCRRELSVLTHHLEAPPFALLEELRSGRALVAAVEATSLSTGVSSEVLAADLGAWFALWAEQGLVIDVVI